MSIQYRPEIDGLRAIAVLSVVLGHAGLGAPSGFVGVDIFFVISGYLITKLLLAEWTESGRIEVFAFYARRVRRLLPALFTVIVSTLVFSQLFIPEAGRKAVAESAAASFLFTANIYFENATRGYFSPDSGQFPLLHLWSLAVEEQFYLIWPFLLLAVLKLSRRALGPILMLLGVCSLLMAEHLVAASPNSAFFQMPARFWELAIGGMVALLPARPGTDARLFALLGLAGAIAAAGMAPSEHFPGVGALPATASAALLLFAVNTGGRLGIGGVVLRNRVMVYVGLISYSLYLWHWPLLVFDRLLRIGESPVTVRVALCLLAVVLAALSHRYIEGPARKAIGTPVRRLVGIAIASSIGLAFMAIAGSVVLAPPQPSTETRLATRAAQDVPGNFYSCHEPAFLPVVRSRRTACIFGEGPISTVIWGDSMGLAWQPFAWAVADRLGGAVASYTRDACAPMLGYSASNKTPSESEYCLAANRQALAQATGVETLIIVARWETNPGSEHALEETLKAASPTVKRILVIGPTPVMPEAVPKCISLGKEAECSISRAEFLKQSLHWRRVLKSLETRHTNVTYVEPIEFFCNATDCPAVRNGYALYWDANHISSSAANDFGLSFRATMLKTASGE